VTLPGWLRSTSAVASTVWVVTEPATNHTLYAARMGCLAGELDGSNNVTSVSIGGTDLAVSLVSYSAETNGAVRVIAQVQNLGAPTATNSVLAIQQYGSTNAPLRRWRCRCWSPDAWRNWRWISPPEPSRRVNRFTRSRR